MKELIRLRENYGGQSGFAKDEQEEFCFAGIKKEES